MTPKIEKHCFSGVGIGAEIKEGESRIRVFREGWNYGMKNDGQVLKVYCDRQAFEDVMAEVKLRAHDVVCDYEHQSEGAPYVVSNGPVAASGWINWETGFEYVDGDGLFVNVAWTEEAADLIRAKKYRYFSPSFNSDTTTGRIFSISSLALTNQPAMLQVKPIAASAVSADNMTPDIFNELGLAVTCGEADVIAAIKELKKRPVPGATQMSTATMNDNEISVAAAKLLGLEGVTDADTLKAAFKAIADAKPTNEAQFTALDTEITNLKAANAKLTKDNDDNAKALADFKSKWSKRDEDDFVARGMSLGKIAKNNENLFRVMFSTQGAEKAEEALKAADVIVAVGGRISASAAGGNPANSGGTAKDEFAKLVDDFKKANPNASQSDAWTAVSKKNPELRKRLVEEANPNTVAA